MAIQRTIGEVTRFPGGKKIASLVVLVVLLMGVLFWKPGSEDDGLPPELAGLGETDAALARLNQEFDLGGASGDGPVDLGGLPSGSGKQPPKTGPAVAIPVPPLPSQPAFRAGVRDIDPEKVRAAFLAGDGEYLASIFRDETYRIAGRAYSLTLAALLESDSVEGALLEVFEGTGEAFSLRETAAYGMMARGESQFSDYLIRVLGRPGVASGQDGEMARLVVLSFFMDRWALEGKALDRVGDTLMELARTGSVTANAALSFGLAPKKESAGILAQLRSFEQNPTVSDNLLAFYETMVAEGREEFRRPLESLRSKAVSGT